MGAEMEGHLMYVFVIMIFRKVSILKYLFLFSAPGENLEMFQSSAQSEEEPGA